jgi:hypothetical protein
MDTRHRKPQGHYLPAYTAPSSSAFDAPLAHQLH